MGERCLARLPEIESGTQNVIWSHHTSSLDGAYPKGASFPGAHARGSGAATVHIGLKAVSLSLQVNGANTLSAWLYICPHLVEYSPFPLSVWVRSQGDSDSRDSLHHFLSVPDIYFVQ